MKLPAKIFPRKFLGKNPKEKAKKAALTTGQLLALLVCVPLSGSCNHILPPASQQYSQQPPPPPLPYPPPPYRAPASPPPQDDPPPRRDQRPRPSLERPDDRDDRRQDDDSDRRYEDRIYRYEDEERDTPLRRPGARGSCESDRECKRMCQRIFRTGRTRNECEDLSIRNVESLFAVHEVLEEPELEELKEMSFNDFKQLMDIETAPLRNQIKKYSNVETRDFLAWMATDRKAADFMAEEDDDYDMLDTLLTKLKTSPIEALRSNIDRGSLLEIAIEENNDILLEYIHIYFKEGSSNSGNSVCRDDRCTFEKYCRLTGGIGLRERRELIDASVDFDSLLQDLVEDFGTEADEDDLDDRKDYKDYCDAEARCLKPLSARTGLNANESYEDEDHPPESSDSKNCYAGSSKNKCNYFTDLECEKTSSVELCVDKDPSNTREDWECL